MGYSDRITRADAKVLEADQQIVNDIIRGVAEGSSVLPLMTRLPNMTSKQAKLPVLASLPEAYWVADDGGLKQTTKVAWKNKFITAEELAVVVPIAEAVLEDADYDIWGEIKPKIIEAIYKKVDEAIILGKNKPASFREGLIPTILNVGNNITYSGSDGTFVQISKAMGKVEADGYDVNGLLGGVALKQAFREGLRDTTGQPLANSEVTELPRYYARNGAWDGAVAQFILGDFKQAVYAIRNDIEFKVFDTGVVSDNSGNIIYNLLQQDMVALRVTFRLGWELPNAINALNSDEATRFPLALVEPSSAPTTYNVVFTVTDGSSDPVQDAEILFAGQYKKTNSSGQATFKSLGSADYLYSVKKGDKVVYGEKTVATANTTVAVENF